MQKQVDAAQRFLRGILKLLSVSYEDSYIWGARAEDLTPYAEEAGMVMVPTRYKVNCCGWRSIHGGDAYLAASSLRARADFELVARGQSAMSTKELMAAWYDICLCDKDVDR